MTQYHQPRSDTYAASNGDHLEVIPLGSAMNEMNRADTTESTVTNDQQQQPQTMTPLQRRNIIFLVLGFSCVVAGLTLIVGTGPIVIQSIGGSAAIAPMSLACFFLGMSVVSCTVTHWCFEKYGWKFGFWFGCVLTVLGSTVSCVGLWMSSTAIVLFSNVILGAGAGIGMYLRFASVDVLPQAFASKGVTWTLCGGCLAAFVGPEVAAAVTGAFGDGYLTFLGVFVVTICFAVAQAVFIGLVAFGKTPRQCTRKRRKEWRR
ncbi:hypothetical protein IV203_027847 [Nitzschia inconspicua]|uniref:Uncharacterized protein n=1 Tax=Nitzschia inconspicua TaxID=303405 RepID=A0A9K3LZK1_9STRA|nr:hypothetical protein IV203_027847 [Nitzschia inconspicua]